MGNIWEKNGKKDVQSLERIHFFLGGRPYLKTNPKKMQGQVMSGPHIWVPMHRFWWSDPRMPMFLQAQRLVTSPDSPDFFCCSAHPIFFVHFLICFFHFSPISRIFHLQLGPISNHAGHIYVFQMSHIFPISFPSFPMSRTMSSHLTGLPRDPRGDLRHGLAVLRRGGSGRPVALWRPGLGQRPAGAVLRQGVFVGPFVGSNVLDLEGIYRSSNGYN